MKKIISLVLSIIMIASCFCTFVSAEYANPDTDKISIVANRTKVKVGDIITVAYYLPENVSISYCDIGAKFDETKLEYVKDSCRPSGKFEIEFEYSKNKNQGVGFVGASKNSYVQDEGVFTAQFKVLNPNATLDAVVGKLFDKNDQPISLETIPLNFQPLADGEIAEDIPVLPPIEKGDFSENLSWEFYDYNGEFKIIGEGRINWNNQDEYLRILDKYSKEIKSVYIPKALEYIDNGFLLSIETLRAIYVDEQNEHLTSIDGVLFDKNITSIICFPSDKDGDFVIPDTVQRIDSYTFSDSNNLKSVTVPKSVEIIDDYAFACAYALEAIYVEEENENYSDDNGVLMNKEKTTLIKYPIAKSGAYNIPNSVTSINSNSFYCCKKLTEITFNDKITTIPTDAFTYCSALKKIELPENITTIESYAFSCCTSLEQITIGNNIQKIGANAFSDTAYSDNDSNWSNGLLYIGQYLVQSNYNATAFNVRKGTTLIADNACYYNRNVTAIILPEGLEVIGENAFLECPNVEYVIIPSTVNKIGKNAIGYTTDNEGQTIPQENFIIYGTYGSCAEQYAVDNGISFDDAENKKLAGDCNGDGKLSVADVRKVVVSIAQNKTDEIYVADMNGDGKISIADAKKILALITKA